MVSLIFRKCRLFYRHISTGDPFEYFIFYQIFTKRRGFVQFLCNISVFCFLNCFPALKLKAILCMFQIFRDIIVYHFEKYCTWGFMPSFPEITSRKNFKVWCLLKFDHGSLKISSILTKNNQSKGTLNLRGQGDCWSLFPLEQKMLKISLINFSVLSIFLLIFSRISAIILFL